MFIGRLLATLYVWQNGLILVEEGIVPPRRTDKWIERQYEVQPSQGWYRARRKPRTRGDSEVRTYVLHLWDGLVDQIEGIIRDLYVLAANMRVPIDILGSKEAGTVRIRATPSFANKIDEHLGYRFDLA